MELELDKGHQKLVEVVGLAQTEAQVDHNLHEVLPELLELLEVEELQAQVELAQKVEQCLERQLEGHNLHVEPLVDRNLHVGQLQVLYEELEHQGAGMLQVLGEPVRMVEQCLLQGSSW